MAGKEKDDFDIKKFVPDEDQRRIYAKVFDRQTIMAVHSLATKGYFDVLEFVISTGKEGHVFRARDVAGNYRAVKIYKIEASEFKQMSKYLEGDIRFQRIKKGKRDLIYAWTKKEFRNLIEMNKAKIRVPLPIAFKTNVLVMEFVGENGEASPRLKDKYAQDAEKVHSAFVDFMAKMHFRARLVHADLSEYNILNKNEELVVIDCGQAVPTTHPNAKEFFERDIRNLSNYLNKIGIKTDEESLTEEIRAKKEEFKK